MRPIARAGPHSSSQQVNMKEPSLRARLKDTTAFDSDEQRSQAVATVRVKAERRELVGEFLQLGSWVPQRLTENPTAGSHFGAQCLNASLFACSGCRQRFAGTATTNQVRDDTA